MLSMHYLAGKSKAVITRRSTLVICKFPRTAIKVKDPFFLISDEGSEMSSFASAVSCLEALKQPPSLLVVDNVHALLQGKNNSQEDTLTRVLSKFSSTTRIVAFTDNVLKSNTDSGLKLFDTWAHRIETSLPLSKVESCSELMTQLRSCH